MSALIGIVILALFTLAIFLAVPFVLAPLVLGAMYLQRRRQLAAEGQTASSTAPARGIVRDEDRELAPAIVRAA